MASNVYRKFPGFRNEEWEVPAGTTVNDVVINNVDGRPGVALTNPGGTVSTVAIPGLVTATVLNGGVGNKVGAATIAVEGYDFLLDVAGVAAGETVGADQTGTPQGTAVYAVVSAGAVTSLTLDGGAGANTKVGIIADGNIIGTVAPVSIGVDL